MMSTPQDPKSATSDSVAGKGASAPVQQSSLLDRVRLNSFGTKLFIAVMGGVLVGIGGITFLFSETVKDQSEEQIRQVLKDNVRGLDNTLSQAETFATIIRTGVLTLHARGIENPDTYRRLIFEAFRERPDFVVGLGVGQSEGGILPQQQWFFAHYRLSTGEEDESGLQFSPPYENIRYIDETQLDQFYPATDRYQTYFLTQQNLWSLPESAGNRLQATFYSPIATTQRWLGTVFVEVDNTAFAEQVNEPILRNGGSLFVLTPQGHVIASPATLTEQNANQTYRSIPGLSAVWEQMTEPSGFIQGEHGYWAYERLSQNDWIAVAFVPYRAVFSPITPIAISGILGVGLLIALVVLWTTRSLRQRLRPVLNECNRLAVMDETLVLQPYQDEIDQVVVAFFNMLSQLQANEEQMRQNVARTVQSEEKFKQAAIAEQENRTLQSEVSNLLQVMAAVEEGNLTVEAEVSSNLTGLVADTLNRLIGRLGRVMAIVLRATERVVQDADQLEQLAITVADNAQQQNQAVTQVQNLIESVSELAQDTAFQATAAHQAMQSTQTELDQGEQKIATISEGIRVLQQGANQILRRTQTLTTYVEQAAQFTKDQKRVAAMTRVLAVNASMLASRAAVQQDPSQFTSITREFEQIAMQVNHLASQTNQNLIQLQQRTNQIETVVSGLNHDAQTINAQSNDFTSSVDQSRQVFQKIKSASQQVAQVGQQVTLSSQAIVEAVQTTLASVQTISAIAAQTSSQSEITQKQAREMEKLAQMLLQELAFFKVPSTVVRDQSLENQLPDSQTQDYLASKHQAPEHQTSDSSSSSLTLLNNALSNSSPPEIGAPR